jgi:hypothetical protein
MTTTKEELVAASIRKQIGYLEGLLAELDRNPARSPDVKTRMHQVETKLRLLRVTLSDETHL